MRNREAAGWAGQAWIGAGPVEGDVALPGPQLKLRVEPGRGRGSGELLSGVGGASPTTGCGLASTWSSQPLFNLSPELGIPQARS